MAMLGKIQRRLSRIWIVRPEAVVTTTELVRAAFPRAFGVITHNHRRSIRRAALRIAVPDGSARIAGGDHCSGVRNSRAIFP